MFARTLIFILLPLTLYGCSAFAPRYLQEADSKSTSGYEELAVLLSKAELGAFKETSSYNDQIDGYSSIIGKFTVAKLAHTNAETASQTSGAQASLNTIIENCISLIKLLAKEHKLDGIVPNSGTTQTVQVGCDIALHAIRATK
ncbi:hypothetical protein [Maritalea sp.]|uniref:hypothetical protein n=1 Tax=Maritalea sp. TaxID=2003361 RepID=UPI003EF525A3